MQSCKLETLYPQRRCTPALTSSHQTSSITHQPVAMSHLLKVQVIIFSISRCLSALTLTSAFVDDTCLDFYTYIQVYSYNYSILWFHHFAFFASFSCAWRSLTLTLFVVVNKQLTSENRYTTWRYLANFLFLVICWLFYETLSRGAAAEDVDDELC